MNPRVSIIIPAFNCDRFLPAAIESIERQDYENIEILVVDDGSTDQTWNTLLRLGASNPKIVPLRNSRTKGTSGARNSGLLAASGEYVAFLDADDLWLHNHLDTGIPFLESTPDVDAVFFNFDVVDYDTGIFLFNWFQKKNFHRRVTTREKLEGFRIILDGMVEALLDECFIHLQSLLVRRRSLGILFDEELTRQEDRDFTLRLALDAGVRFAFKDVVTGIYHRHSRSLTHPSVENIVGSTNDHIRLYSSYLERFTFRKETVRRIRRIVRERHLSNCYFFRKQGKFSSSLSSLLSSCRWGWSPGQLKELLKIAAELGRGNSLRRHRDFRTG